MTNVNKKLYEQTLCNIPSLEQFGQNHLSHIVREEVEMERVSSIKQDRLYESHNITCGIMTSAHNGDIDYLKKWKAWKTVKYFWETKSLEQDLKIIEALSNNCQPLIYSAKCD